jgi:hypothetical protein
MVPVKKKRILLLSNGSLVANKTFIKASSRIQFPDKDHVNFLLNRKKGKINRDSKTLKDFKFKYFKF